MIVNVFVANEKLRTNDLDDAVEMLRATVENEYANTDMLRCGATTAALVQALLRRADPPTFGKRKRPSIGFRPCRPDPHLSCHLWLLPMRAAQARARGDGSLAYHDYRDRYRNMAKSLGFQGHIAWAEAMPSRRLLLRGW